MNGRHSFVCALLCVLLILAQTTNSLPQSRHATDRSRNSVAARDWENRLMASDPKVRAIAEATLVEGAQRSLPLLRRFLNRRNEDLHVVTFELIQRIGPPAIPLLVDLLRDKRPSIRRSAVDD
jgi:HEAT repeat protein